MHFFDQKKIVKQCITLIRNVILLFEEINNTRKHIILIFSQ